VDDNCALLGCYAVSSGNFLPTFRDNLSVLSSRTKNLKAILSHGQISELVKLEISFDISALLGYYAVFFLEDRTDRLSRNVGKKSPLLAS